MKRAFLSAAIVATATLSGLTPSPATAQDSSSGAVSIEILVEGQPADSAPGPTVAPGETLRLDYVVTVSGSQDLYDLAVRDTSGAKPSCDTNGDGQPDGFSVHPGPLGAGSIFTCTATVAAQAADGAVAIIATVSATDYDGVGTFEDQDPAHYTPSPSPTTTTAAPPTTASTSAPPTTTPSTQVTSSSTAVAEHDDATANEPRLPPSERELRTAYDVNPPPGDVIADIDIEILLDNSYEPGTPSGDDAEAEPPVPVVFAESETDLAWSFVVTNTGGVNLDEVEVTAVEIVEEEASTRTTPRTVTCPWEDTGSLPPGRAIRCTASTPAPLTPGPLTMSATVRAAPAVEGIGTDDGPVDHEADFKVTIEGIDGVAFADDTPLLLGFGIAFALLAAASLVLWLLSGKPDLDDKLP